MSQISFFDSWEDAAGVCYQFTQAGPGSNPLRHNLGTHVGDDASTVQSRRTALAQQFGGPVIWMNQTHSATVAVLTPDDFPPGSSRSAELGPIEADGIVIDTAQWECPVALSVMTADCVPVLLASADGRFLGAVHAGRGGLERNILGGACDVFEQLGATSEVHAVIGPAICGSCYEVPQSMHDDFIRLYPHGHAVTRWGSCGLDLPAAAAQALRERGCRVTNIDRCTFEDPFLHSYRRDSNCGRQASIIGQR